MCGICGVLGSATREELARMTDSLAHRGPDGQGLWHANTQDVHFGHRRLAIVDVESGAQPMHTSDGAFSIVFNGEIYNHAALRQELETLGHRFQTDHSDTETLLLAYREWGAAMLPRLNGMFAFAVYDAVRREVFFARDRFGEKPLFYSLSPQGLAFASELQAFRHWQGFQPALHTDNIQRYLGWGYFTGGRTMYRQTFSLRAGHAMRVPLDSLSHGVEYKSEPFWRFTLEPEDSWNSRTVDDLAEELRQHILSAVSLRLMSDVPLGLFLSGGVDSSCMAAAMSRLREPGSVQAFSVGFTEPSFDESLYAREVAKHCGLSHYVEVLDMGKAMTLIPEVLGRMGEALGDSSLLPTWLLSQFTRKHVTVALSGDAGDELFAGYDPFLALRPAAMYSKLVPGWLHAYARRVAELVPPSDRNMSLEFKIKRTLKGLSHRGEHWFPAWMGPLDESDMKDLFARPLSADALYEDVDIADGKTLLEKTLLFYTRHYLTDNILTKVDRASMLASLESRAVFLDNGIVGFCQKLPQQYKLHGNTRKYILKKAMEPWLPSHILYRKKKGFGIPLNRWMREYPLQSSNLGCSDIRIAPIAERIARHKARRGDERAFLWAWLSLQHAVQRGSGMDS